MLKTTVFVLAVAFVTKGIFAAQVAVEPKEKTVLPGDSVTYLCRLAVPLQYCRIEIPGFQPVNLNKESATSELSYFGKGLEFGECGFTIQRAQDKNNGDVKCTLGIPSESTESVGTMRLVVAKAPNPPALDLTRGRDSLGVYKINDVLEASCIVSDGRPVANLSWFLDDEPIPENELTMPTEMTIAKDNLHSRIQNLTRTLRATDNGRSLRCVAEHPAYPNGRSETSLQLNIEFPPLPIYDSLDRFDYQIGKMGLINVTIEANPQPQVEWDIGGQKIREGSTDNTGRINAEGVTSLGRSKYIANLRIAAVKKEDTETEYILTAHNSYGFQEYRLRISTNPEPEGVDLGIGAVIGIVVAILFVILLVSILIFAKVTGRWCFSGGSSDHRNLGESSDTESADVRPRETKKAVQPIKFTSFFKKNKDKVSSEDEPEVTQMETEENKQAPEEINTTLRTEAEPKEGLVYAELDLVRADMKPVVKKDDEKTEYAEILYTPATGREEESEPPTK